MGKTKFAHFGGSKKCFKNKFQIFFFVVKWRYLQQPKVRLQWLFKCENLAVQCMRRAAKIADILALNFLKYVT